MANEVVEVGSQKKSNVLLNNLSVLATPEGFQKFVMGTKGNGQERAIYDIIRDQQKLKGKKKKGKKKGKKKHKTTYDLYLSTTEPKKKKKKKHKKNKHWHI